MSTIEKNEDDLINEIRTTNKVMLDLQNGKYSGLNLHDAMERHRKYKEQHNDFDWSDEERDDV